MTLVGIDLGTTNSLIGYWREGESVLIPNAHGKLLTPSVVGVSDGGDILVGATARERLVSHPLLTAAAFKRYMGTDKVFELGKEKFRAEELSALVLKALKADAEAALGEAVREAVITVPAYFNDAQRKATKVAGELAGLKVDLLLTEPTAAALAYGFSEDEESEVLILDLGGGTLDVSLVHCFEGIMEVKAAAGDIWLGGEDFTEALMGEFLATAGKKAGIDGLKSGDPMFGSLRRQAEAAKLRLSEADSAEIALVHGEETISWSITRERFEQLSEPILARVRLPLERALRDGKTAPERLGRIIFAGGATRMPMFRRMISRLFRQLPLTTINPDEVVARGAAVRAGLAAGGKGLEEHVLTDVAPFTLGVGISRLTDQNTRIDGVFAPIIERNTVIPVSRAEIFQTMADNQREVELSIYQGEARFVRDNVRLGTLSVPVPQGPAGKEQVEVRFSYDPSGLLEVDVTVLSNKHRQNMVIEGNPGVLSPAEVKARLAALEKLKIHPREDSENSVLVARAGRLFEENLGPAREIIGQALDRFMGVLERQDREEIARHREEFAKFLDGFDRSPFA